MKKTIAVLVGVFLTASTAVFASDYPILRGYINDPADVISQQKEDELEKKLESYEKDTTNQIFVLSTNDIGEIPIEEYSIGLAEYWNPGTEKEDNGVILLINPENRQLRIEVGQGLEGQLTDLESHQIIENSKQYLESGDYDAGVDFLVSDIQAHIASDSTELESTDGVLAGTLIVGGVITWIIIFVILLIVSPDLAFIFLRITLLAVTSGKSGTSGKGGKFSGGGSSSKF